MNRLQKNPEFLPKYSIIPLILAFSFNMAVYGGARMIAGGWHHYNIETRLDKMIPFWPPSAAVYLGCYLFWAVNYVLMARQEKEGAFRFFAADMLSRIVCFFCYLVFPTTNTRPDVAAPPISARRFQNRESGKPCFYGSIRQTPRTICFPPFTAW